MKRAVILGFACVAAVAPALAATNFSQRILAAHNVERAAVGVPPLVWSDTLADDAVPWAAHLAQLGDLEHSGRDQRRGEGENLWMGTQGAYSLEAMVGAWASEKRDYSYGLVTATSNDGKVTGHYTQMIWKNTTEVGCALVSGGGNDVLVCRYAPPGNYVGERPY